MMLLEVKTPEEIQQMSPEEFEAYVVHTIGELHDGIKDLLDMASEATTLPNIAVLAALIEVAVKCLRKEEPGRSEDINHFIKHFVDVSSRRDDTQTH